ncbi:protein UXT homolog [Megalopta genalis]|uniref:protein UXT homolog n=1 Tax=Megalopta genalis TaxID=115081 RepID=UPI003FD03DE1
MNPDIQHKILLYETIVNDVLKDDLLSLEQKLDSKNTEIAEFVQLKSVIATLQDNEFDKCGFKTQINVGQNFYIEAQVPDASTILLDIGLGHYLELTLDRALVVINARIKLLEEQIALYRKEIAKAKAHIKLILLLLRELQGIKE